MEPTSSKCVSAQKFHIAPIEAWTTPLFSAGSDRVGVIEGRHILSGVILGQYCLATIALSAVAERHVITGDVPVPIGSPRGLPGEGDGGVVDSYGHILRLGRGHTFCCTIDDGVRLRTDRCGSISDDSGEGIGSVASEVGGVPCTHVSIGHTHMDVQRRDINIDV